MITSQAAGARAGLHVNDPGLFLISISGEEATLEGGNADSTMFNDSVVCTELFK